MKLTLQMIWYTAFSILFFAVLLFWPAGTFDYWQAWVFIAVFMVATMIPSFYLAVKDPATLQRRLKAGPTAVVVIGNVLVLAGLAVAELVVIQNNYAAATITVEADQPVVSTGLYGVVRHPMYVGALIMMAGMPLALASYWGLLTIIPGVLVFAARITDEEKALRQGLEGYDDYTQKVHYRLVPGLW